MYEQACNEKFSYAPQQEDTKRYVPKSEQVTPDTFLLAI
jgi:hypothetical protein